MPLWGEMCVERDEVDLVIVVNRLNNRKLETIWLGIMKGFPITDAWAFYCFDDDLIYYFPFEAYGVDPPRPQLHVYPFRRMEDLVSEFL